MAKSISLTSSKILISLLSAISLNIYSTPQTVIAPNCLLDNPTLDRELITHNTDYSLLQLDSNELAKLTGEHHKKILLSDGSPCGKFQDVSIEWKSFINTHQDYLTNPKKMSNFLLTHQNMKPQAQINPFIYTNKIKYASTVKNAINQIQKNRFWNNLAELSNTDIFPDRYAKSDNGLKAANWFKDKVEAITKETGRTDVSWRFVETGENFKQPSLIVRVGNQPDNIPGVVVSSHMDTTSQDSYPYDGVKPGADDDGSGSVITLEVLEVILKSKQKFNKPIYFMWYAAEELGLIGSKVVAADFVNKKIPLDSILHLEVAGYQNAGDEKKLWVLHDNVNPGLSQYIEMLAMVFSDIKEVSHTKCGYACSDHASWNNAGYNVAIPVEAKFEESNPYMHTANDNMDHISKEHMLKFAKLGIAFVIERAEPTAG